MEMPRGSPRSARRWPWASRGGSRRPLRPGTRSPRRPRTGATARRRRPHAPSSEAAVGRPPAAAAALINDNGWNTGGTGGTADFGWNSEAVIRMMAQQAQLMQAARGEAKQREREEAAPAASAAPAPQPFPPPQQQAQPRAAQTWAPPARQPVDDEVGKRLEEMVEELAGVHSFEHSVELLEDAFSKVDAAREALSRVVTNSGLRHSAPAFVPGQMWTGQQRSSFVD